MNCWHWDDRLGDKPDNFDNLPNWIVDLSQESKNKYITPIMNAIEDRIGRKEILREWNVYNSNNNLGMSEDEFEDWYTTGNIPERLYKGSD